MHKSVTNFSLFLFIGSLIMLVPFTSINFSNVKAQEYGSYDDDYDNSYSTYPTDDKKYECRTGPAEGFFVSSVEFCKHIKFDDRKDHARDNQTGTQSPPGPPGPPGPTGSTGSQGPPGANRSCSRSTRPTRSIRCKNSTCSRSTRPHQVHQVQIGLFQVHKAHRV